MAEILTAWENGIFLSKFIVIVLITAPIWGGIITGLHYYFYYYLLEEQPKEFKKNEVVV